MTPHDYHALRAISSHWLLEILKSPVACWRKYLDPNRLIEQPTAALRLGTVVHTLALTPHQFERSVTVIDYERRSVAGKKRYADLLASGLTVIRPAEFEKARTIVAALHADREARRLLRHGKKERTIIQPRAAGLLPLKARLDVHHESQRQIIELKTAHDLGLVAIAMQRYRYLLSAAFYQHLARGQSVVWVFVQTTPPHQVAVIPLERQQLQAGREQWQTALVRFDDCWRRNDWPEVDPAPFDDDLLWMDAFPAVTAQSPRFQWPVGELTL